MRKIRYNLAGTRKIDSRAFALTLALLVMAALLFSAGTYFNLSRQRQQERIEKKAFGRRSRPGKKPGKRNWLSPIF
jgi:hypothetical protein